MRAHSESSINEQYDELSMRKIPCMKTYMMLNFFYRT